MKLESRTGCCGARSISGVYPNRSIKDMSYEGGFIGASVKKRQEIILQWMYQNTSRDTYDGERYGASKSFEIILTANEITNAPDFCKWLRSIGFRCVQRFMNPTGSECYVLLYTAKPLPVASEDSAWHKATKGTKVRRKNFLGEKPPKV